MTVVNLVLFLLLPLIKPITGQSIMISIIIIEFYDSNVGQLEMQPQKLFIPGYSDGLIEPPSGIDPSIGTFNK